MMTSARTTTVTTRHKLSVLDTPNPKSLTLTDDLSAKTAYQIETRDSVQIPVPFSSSLSVSLHLLSWLLCGLYYWKRFQGVYQCGSLLEWTIYFCEAAFMLQELQGAIEMSVSLFGPRKTLEHPQYILKGTRAPKVHVLVTYDSSPLKLRLRALLC